MFLQLVSYSIMSSNLQQAEQNFEQKDFICTVICNNHYPHLQLLSQER